MEAPPTRVHKALRYFVSVRYDGRHDLYKVIIRSLSVPNSPTHTFLRRGSAGIIALLYDLDCPGACVAEVLQWMVTEDLEYYFSSWLPETAVQSLKPESGKVIPFPEVSRSVSGA